MKLAELGLKTKPETHYFKHGYVSFLTVDGVLYYKITAFDDDKSTQFVADSGLVRDAYHLKKFITCKNLQEALL